jgi:ATP-dependent Zn protease
MRQMKSSKQLQATAYHEAGHAVACRANGVRIKKATIIFNEEDGSAGAVHHEFMFRGMQPNIKVTPRFREALEAHIMIKLAGAIAQRKFAPRSVRKYHAASDYRSAGHLALLYICENDAKICSAYLQWLQLRTQHWVDVNWRKISRVADALLTHKTLSGQEVKAIINEL